MKTLKVFFYIFLCQLILSCSPDQNTSEKNIVVTVFLYENCPIAQDMCGPLRDVYHYFRDTLNKNINFRGFSPNAFSTSQTISLFQQEYSIPFALNLDYDTINGVHGAHTLQYFPIKTPEAFVECNDELIYRGMIDNSYLELGVFLEPTEHYLFQVLEDLINGENVAYFETIPIGCLINY